jgi:hypothetical protein
MTRWVAGRNRQEAAPPAMGALRRQVLIRNLLAVKQAT